MSVQTLFRPTAARRPTRLIEALVRAFCVACDGSSDMNADIASASAARTDGRDPNQPSLRIDRKSPASKQARPAYGDKPIDSAGGMR